MAISVNVADWQIIMDYKAVIEVARNNIIKETIYTLQLRKFESLLQYTSSFF